MDSHAKRRSATERTAFLLRGATAMLVLAAVALHGCAAQPVAPYKAYRGPERSISELAVVRFGDANAAEFDGEVIERTDWSEVQLLPGEHAIRWQTEFLVSVLVEPSGFAAGGNAQVVRLAAGHTYTLKADRTTGPGYQTYFWIRDDADGRVIAGMPKP